MQCQKCRAPIKLDNSLEDLSPAALKLLVEATSRTLQDDKYGQESPRRLFTPEQKRVYDEATRGSSAPTIKRVAQASTQGQHARDKSGDLPGMSFIMLTQSQMGPSAADSPKSKSKHHRASSNKQAGEGSLSQRAETMTRLFEILSSRSDIDHPICVECTDLLIEGMDEKLNAASKERDIYIDYLKHAQANVPTDEERTQVETEMKALQARESEAFAELKALEKERANLEEELGTLEVESHKLDEEERAFWRERNAFSQELSMYREERDSLRLRYEHDAGQLDKLQRTNVYNDTFNITYDKDDMGTINGLRLGRSSSTTVEWPEINAAWGQALLLLVVVAEKLKYTFKGYRLRPLGSTSYIDKLDQGQPQNDSQHSTALELFYTSDLPVSLSFFHKSFDAAMVAFLECVRQLGVHIERTVEGTERSKTIPFVIKADQIGDVSIKLGSVKKAFNNDDGWTKACKLTLVCCKFCLAHASNADASRVT